MRLPYHSYAGADAITYYETGRDWIELTFRGGKQYRYTKASAGQGAVRKLKQLAASGRGLHAYVAQQRPRPEE